MTAHIRMHSKCFAAVGGNKEGAKKFNLSRNVTSSSCDASMQKEKEKSREREKGE
jgi:hypothetical protein